MPELWWEVWTRPGDPNFGRLIDDPPTRFSTLHAAFVAIGAGSAAMPNTYARFDDILKIDGANSRSSLWRLFSDSDPTEPVFEWLPEAMVPTASKRDPDVTVSGPDIKQVLTYPVTEPYDWDGSAEFTPVAPDWIYGGEDILQNGDFETVPFPNGGFEDGNTGYWQITQPDGFLTSPVGLIAVKDALTAESGDWYGLIDAPPQKAGAARTFSGLEPGGVYTITGKLQDPTASGDRYRSGVAGAVTATHVNAYQADGYWWAEIDNAPSGTGASDGTWQDFSLIFEAATTSITLIIIYDTAGTGPDTRIDTWTITGPGLGLYPWRPLVPDLTSVFQYESTIVDTGLGAVQWRATDSQYTSPFGISSFGFSAGIEQPISLVVGHPYTASIRVRQDSGIAKNYRLVIERQTPVGEVGSPGSSFINSATVSIPSGVYTTIQLQFTPDVTEALFQLRYVGTAGTLLSPITYSDNAHLFKGLPATTLGDILAQLYTAYTDPDLRIPIVWDDGSGTDTPYLTLDFDAVNDSNGNPWADAELQTRVWMRQTLYDVLESFAYTRGYEFRVVPDNVETGTWLLQVYNPDGMQTDHTSQPSPAIQGGTTDTRRQIRRFLPSTAVMVEGLGRITARADNLTGVLGRIESARLDRELPDQGSVSAAAAEDINDAELVSQTWVYTLTDPREIPLDAYKIGDLLTVHDPPDADGPARFVDVVARFASEPTEWDTSFEPEPTTSPGSP